MAEKEGAYQTRHQLLLSAHIVAVTVNNVHITNKAKMVTVTMNKEEHTNQGTNAGTDC
ncbi:hypothetical protein DPMN_011102 [Dreissena polymorpha]|uniref:Uncharacterized protein n=1 Tax=Dreissena polymorpha TaxID=45954 RepID=A0A9D4S263_DREPO|nr:hypothetical protein DPMN_011102 [Dreissena polymorpha]